MRSSGGLWRHADFKRLWAGQTISELGSRITREGLPLVALLGLGAGPAQLGLLTAVGSAMVVAASLPAGAWVDRLRRKPIMIAADIGRAGVIALVPLAALSQQLRIELLYVTIAVVGVLTVLFNAAYEAYLPALIEREQLVEGNSKLALSSAMAEVLGPGLAGWLVQLLTAPVAMIFDAVSYVASIVSLLAIRQPEPPPALPAGRPRLGREMAEGLRRVWGDPILRALALAGGTRSFFGNFIGALYSLYLIRDLGLSAAALGVTVAMGGVGGLAGAALADRVTRRLGVGRTLIVSLVAASLLTFLIPLAGGSPLVAMLMLLPGQLFGDALSTIYAINQVSVRQTVTPGRLLGRVSTSTQLLVAGIGPAGALVGGVLAEAIGVRATLMIAATGIVLSTGWIIFSPLRGLREHAAVAGASEV